MKYKIKSYLENIKLESYVKDTEDDTLSGDIIDCSLGVNPFGFPTILKDKNVNFFNMIDINNYPEFPYSNFKKEIIYYWKDHCNLEQANVKFGTGSIGILLNINRMFVEKDTMILGYCPTFTSYVSDVKLNQGKFDGVFLKPEDNYKFNSESLMLNINNDYSLIYIDNPNNPTGQVIPLGEIKEIIEKACDSNVCVIVDEAYGDFMDNSNSAVSLVNEFENLMVVRSFSKGFGLAGLRVGYLMTSNVLSNYYSKIDVPFTINTAGQFAAMQALKDKEFILKSRKSISEVKEVVKKTFKKMRVLHTDNEVPIMTIEHPDKEVNLYDLFKKHNVLTESGEDFTGLGRNFVRLRIPSKADRIVAIIEKIETNKFY